MAATSAGRLSSRARIIRSASHTTRAPVESPRAPGRRRDAQPGRDLPIWPQSVANVIRGWGLGVYGKEDPPDRRPAAAGLTGHVAVASRETRIDRWLCRFKRQAMKVRY